MGQMDDTARKTLSRSLSRLTHKTSSLLPSARPSLLFEGGPLRRPKMKSDKIEPTADLGKTAPLETRKGAGLRRVNVGEAKTELVAMVEMDHEIQAVEIRVVLQDLLEALTLMRTKVMNAKGGQGGLNAKTAEAMITRRGTQNALIDRSFVISANLPRTTMKIVIGERTLHLALTVADIHTTLRTTVPGNNKTNFEKRKTNLENLSRTAKCNMPTTRRDWSWEPI